MTPQFNDNLKKLLRETGRDSDPFKDIGTLNCIERTPYGAEGISENLKRITAEANRGGK